MDSIHRPGPCRIPIAAAVTLSLAVSVADPATARLVATRRECRQACAELIDLCVGNGAKRPYCRRAIVRTCRHVGLPWCEVTTTTWVVTTSTTTTTIDPGPTVHGCNRVKAEDHRGEPLVVVEVLYFDFAPECIRVSVGTVVRFHGDFRRLPLYGGKAPDVDPSSPFAPPTTSGDEKDFTLSEPGIFPYFSDLTWVALFRMWGAVIVEQ